MTAYLDDDKRCGTPSLIATHATVHNSLYSLYELKMWEKNYT